MNEGGRGVIEGESKAGKLGRGSEAMTEGRKCE